MSKKSQPRLTDLKLNTISAGQNPTPVYLLEPETKSLSLLPTKTKKTKERKTKTKHPPPVQHWEEKKTPKALKAWRQNPGPNGQGKTEPKNKAGRRRREASPPEDKFLSRRLSNFCSLEDSRTFSLYARDKFFFNLFCFSFESTIGNINSRLVYQS